ncbi:uncharacterized protein CcaverHIS019_0407030 [Cutaneotrichosporon cavernicola]|uniref:Peroxisomal membrane protein 4 n=1 Tax=Cutaneotrichosporon cavernicola TaxID=279322 RepID=A0AA48L4P9_9TREE|nr:uncharacterized protein CcaverHIS019_0407030 [Cutaneotrichosporon cavernicola]BEI91883.1 hypothetical protein CcaverHIS019_0407030 [Cutaneotrichosporon cavernicola]BEI99655.1 hypothetical protein CcaverHIS631_0406980 [Cutaneotrichosporon cavernicola]BEJ07429.1 hypothetical protein CcaverHIS641_0406980 [Cutaneotrichosporon cavernicola]
MSSAIQKWVMDPANHDFLAIVKGARNGLVYGCKVRFPHALVMAALFSHKPWSTRIHGILTATRTHAMSLAKFAVVYKIMLLVQKRLNGGMERDLDTFVAGGIGGYTVFGDRTPINEQIVLYIMSRAILSFIPRLYSNSPNPPKTPWQPLDHPLPSLTSPEANPRPIPPANIPFAIVASLSWAAVMYMFRHRGERLQPGIINSMRYIYHESDTWTSLKTLLWHNK